jgi:hypothetical protein
MLAFGNVSESTARVAQLIGIPATSTFLKK